MLDPIRLKRVRRPPPFFSAVHGQWSRLRATGFPAGSTMNSSPANYENMWSLVTARRLLSRRAMPVSRQCHRVWVAPFVVDGLKMVQVQPKQKWADGPVRKRRKSLKFGGVRLSAVLPGFPAAVSGLWCKSVHFFAAIAPHPARPKSVRHRPKVSPSDCGDTPELWKGEKYVNKDRE